MIMVKFNQRRAFKEWKKRVIELRLFEMFHRTPQVQDKTRLGIVLQRVFSLRNHFKCIKDHA